MTIKAELLELEKRLDRILAELENRKSARPVLKVIAGGKEVKNGTDHHITQR